MSAARLREAAKMLREKAEDGTSVVEITHNGNSTTAYRNAAGDYYLDRQGSEYGSLRTLADWPDIAQTDEWHELMRPDVALALADWLDLSARRMEAGLGLPGDYAKGPLAVADLILCGAS